jgi:hypothetical protein
MVVMVVIKFITTHYCPVLLIKHSKRKPELPLIAVDRVFSVPITVYYFILLDITTITSIFLLLPITFLSNELVMEQ